MGIFRQQASAHESWHKYDLSNMPFFFIVPVWLFFVLLGLVLLIFPRHRKAGPIFHPYFDSLNADLSFRLDRRSLSGIQDWDTCPGRWFGVAVIGGYLLAIGFGVVLGELRVSFSPADWQIDSLGRGIRSGQLSYAWACGSPIDMKIYTECNRDLSSAGNPRVAHNSGSRCCVEVPGA